MTAEPLHVLLLSPLSERLDQLLASADVVRVSEPTPGDEPHLVAGGDELSLRFRGAGGDVRVSTAQIEQRSRGASDLAKACAAKSSPVVLDAMAGLGVDSAVLAARGCAVEAVEREPVVALLQADLADRVQPTFRPRSGDAWDVLAAGVWDVVYLDPMFPSRNKTALPGKRLQAIEALVREAVREDTRSVESWLDRAAERATRRVVLKRRSKDPVVGRPSGSIRGRAVRFDIYPGRCVGPEVAL